MDELTQIRDRIKAMPVPIRELAARAGVKERWLRTFVAGDTPEPGYAKIRRVRRAIVALTRSTREKAAA